MGEYKSSNPFYKTQEDFSDWYDEEYIIELLSNLSFDDIESVIDILNEYNLLAYDNETLIHILNEFPDFQSSKIIEEIKKNVTDNETKDSIFTNILRNVNIHNREFFLEILSELENLDEYDEETLYRVSKLASFFGISLK